MPDLQQILEGLRGLVGNRQSSPTVPEEGFRQFRKEALQALLQTGSDNYKENARISGVIEDKSQKAGAVAGIFLAAGLAFVKPGMTLAQLGGRLGFFLLCGSIALLLTCIGLCLAVMWVRPGRSALLLSDLQRMVRDISGLSSDELTPEIKEGFFLDQANLWAATLEEQVGKNNQKAILLKRAQVTLVAAMFLVAIFLFSMLLQAYRCPNL